MTHTGNISASLGERWGGCEHCEATYRVIYRGEGVSHMIITHQRSCPIVLRRLYDWSGDLHGRQGP